MLGADPAWSHQVPLCLCPHLQPEPSPQSCPCSPTAGAGLPASPEWSASPSPCPGPLTAAVAGAAGVLLKVGEESVAWAAGRGEAFAQSLVTHWPQGPQGLSPGGQNNSPPTASSTAQPLDAWSLLWPPAARAHVPGRSLRGSQRGQDREGRAVRVSFCHDGPCASCWSRSVLIL